MHPGELYPQRAVQFSLLFFNSGNGLALLTTLSDSVALPPHDTTCRISRIEKDYNAGLRILPHVDGVAFYLFIFFSCFWERLFLRSSMAIKSESSPRIRDVCHFMKTHYCVFTVVSWAHSILESWFLI